MLAVYSDSFNIGIISTCFSEDDSTSGYPATATNEEIIDRVHHPLMNDRLLTIDQIVNAISIPYERVEHILHNEHGRMKLYGAVVWSSVNRSKKVSC